jgi:multiple sugar transport system permease protein
MKGPSTALPGGKLAAGTAGPESLRSRSARSFWANPGRVAVLVAVALGAVLMVMPFIWMLSTSLKPSGQVLSLPPQFLPESPTLDAYRRIFDRFPLWRVMGNSALVALLSTAGQLLICSMSGYAFARFRFRGRETLFLLYLMTLMIPFAVTIIPLFIIVKNLGWTNSYAGLTVPGMFSAFGTFLMRQFFQSIPHELAEAATIDGAGTVRTFFTIIAPLSGPPLATLGLLSFMGSWNNFLWPLLRINDRNLMTLPLALSTLQGIYPGQNQWNLLMAGAVVAVVPIMIVFLFAQRWFIEGVASSGLKG